MSSASNPGLTLVDVLAVEQDGLKAITGTLPGTRLLNAPPITSWVNAGDYLLFDYDAYVATVFNSGSTNQLEVRAALVQSGDATVNAVHTSNPRFASATGSVVEDNAFAASGSGRWKVTQAGYIALGVELTIIALGNPSTVNVGKFNTVLEIYRPLVPGNVPASFANPRSVPGAQYQET